MHSLGRPQLSGLRAASFTQLPPSPEASSQGSALAGIPQPTTLSLGSDRTSMIEEAASSRLRSVATYAKFHPQALACSPPTFRRDGQSAQTSSEDNFSSLGAISGEGGIALFRTSRPDAPLLMLSHSSMVGNLQSGGIQNLAFEPTLTDSVLLAASRGNGLLIWDASGHSLSPLLGRLSMDLDERSSTSYDICSMAWKATDGAQSMIATTTSSCTCLWDLRVSLGAKSSKPSLRFGSLSHSAPLIQVACSHKDECATMDSTGVVRVYDLRMFGGAKPRMKCIFPSFHFAGVGLAAFRTRSDDSYWMAWGLDAPKADAVVKIWSTVENNGKNDEGDVDSDTYWHMDGSPGRTLQLPSTEFSASVHTGVQVAQFTMPFLACARICPAPMDNSVVTVGLPKGGGPGWKAELWKLRVDVENSSVSTDTFGIEKVVSFSEDRSFEYWKLNPVGPLRCAELAVSPAPFPTSRAQEQEGNVANDDWELLLCCMTKDGLLTTSVVTEAPNATHLLSPPETGRHRLARRSLRYVPNERRGNSTMDAASALRSFDDSVHGRNDLNASRHAYAHRHDSRTSSPTPSKNIDKPVEKSTGTELSKVLSSLRGEGSLMPFDMDVGFVPIIIEDASTGPGSVASGDEGGGVELSLQQSRISKRVSTDRVPCPRLCGATFSPGLGGLVGFNNGQINKMWSWYTKNELRRKSSGLKYSSTMKENSSYPRLKKDLDDMITAAKDAQWGENQEDHGTADNESEDSNDDPFDDLSSEDEGEVDSIAPSGQEGADKSESVYQPYFGGDQNPTAYPFTSGSNSTTDGGVIDSKRVPITHNLSVAEVVSDLAVVGLHSLRQISSFDGPTSDVLAPVVCICFDTDLTMFNGQTAELAANLLLGDWNVFDPNSAMDEHKSEGDLDVSLKAGWSERRIPNYRPERGTPLLAHSSFEKSSGRLHSVQSDPTVHLTNKFILSHQPPSLRDDEPVHGGEYAVRPRGEESMVFLRKLLPSPYQPFMSPPDSHLLPNKLQPASVMKRSASSGAMLQTVRSMFKTAAVATQVGPWSGHGDDKTNIGVFTLPTQHAAALPSMSGSLLKLICVYNSNVCAEYGQPAKADTWSILAHAVENHLLDEGCNDSFSGWDGAEIGRELVGSILRFYETEGDIQMVASIICVLNTGHRVDGSHPRSTTLLPLDQNDKYDLYIQRYAELVFRWGLLTKRVELLKHLSRRVPSTDGLQMVPSSLGNKNDLEMGSDRSAKYGISFGGTCHRCSAAISTSDSNVCSNCRDYAVRCSLCDNAVRGLFTVCARCGHGGHLNHIMSWFMAETKCPTGCGCDCVFSSLDTRDSPSALMVSEDPELVAVQRRIHPYDEVM